MGQKSPKNRFLDEFKNLKIYKSHPTGLPFKDYAEPCTTITQYWKYYMLLKIYEYVSLSRRALGG